MEHNVSRQYNGRTVGVLCHTGDKPSLLVFRIDGRQSSAASSYTDGTASSVGDDRPRKHGHRRKRKKDFIKRNKEVS